MELVESEAEQGATAILKRVAPAWWWLRDNFKLPAVLTIAGLVAFGGAWLWQQRQMLNALEARPDLAPQLAGLAARLDADERAQLGAGHERRITELEGYWRDAGKVAAERPRRRR